MTTLMINGRKVQVDDSFLSMSPEQQNATVDEIAASIGAVPQETADATAKESQQSVQVRSELSDLSSKLTKSDYESRPEWQKPIIALQDTLDVGLNGLTMGFGDKGAAALRSAFTDKTYEQELEAMRQRTEGARERAGMAGTVAEIGGAVAAPIGLASKGVTLAGRFGTTAMTGAKGLAARSALMGAEGAAYGATSALGNDADIGQGAALGATAGALVPVAVAAGRALTKPLSDAVRARLNPEGFAAEKVSQRLSSSMDIDQAGRRMAAHPGLSLADVGGKSTRDLLRTAVNIPGPARDRVASQLTLRQMGQGDRLKSIVAKTIADPDGYMAAKDEIADTAQRVAKPLFDKAFKTPVHFSETLEGVLRTPAGRSALNKASQLAGNEQIPFQQLFINVTKDGASARRVPDARAWHYIKMAFDDMIDAQTDTITKKVTNEGRILIGLKNKMLAEVDRFNPAYKAARNVWAGQKSLDDALEFGRKAAMQSPEAVKRTVANLSASEKEAARAGLADWIRSQIDQRGFTQNAILRFFSNRQQVKNIRALFDNDEQFATFRKAIFGEAKKRATYEAVKGNSTTAAQMMDLAEAGGLADGSNAARTAVTSGPLTATMQFVGSRLKMLGGLTPQVADNVAKMLTAAQPRQVASIVQELSALEKARLTAAQRSEAIQSLIVRSLGAGAGVSLAH
jgi:hypothetical protein